MLFQELFYGPYFCQVQDAAVLLLHREDPRRPDHQADAGAGQADRHGARRADVRGGRAGRGIYYNTAAVIDADGKYLGKYRKTHIPHVKGFWEKFYFRPGNMGYPVFETAVGKVGVYICYDRHFPEGARALGLNGAEMVFIPSATSRGLSEYLWRIEQVPTRSRTATSSARSTASASREDLGDDDFYGQSYFVDPRGQFIGEVGDAHNEELLVARHGPRQDPGSAPDVAVLPRPSARRVRRSRPALSFVPRLPPMSAATTQRNTDRRPHRARDHVRATRLRHGQRVLRVRWQLHSVSDTCDRS